MGANIDLKIISIAVAISLIVGAGAGYMVGNSPVTSLIEEKEVLKAEYEVLDLDFQSLEVELDSIHELLAKEAMENDLLQERYREMLVIDQENQLLTQQVIDLENQTDELNSQLDLLSEHSQVLEAQLSELLDPGSSSSSYQGRLDTWYHYREANTEEENPQYDAKVIDGSWSLVELPYGTFSLMMTWTELNINEEVEGAPPGTYDTFIVTITTRNINIVEDPDFPEMFVLYGDAHWQKTNWDGKVGKWNQEVQIEIIPYHYYNQFRYIQLYGAGNELLIYGSFYPS